MIFCSGGGFDHTNDMSLRESCLGRNRRMIECRITVCQMYCIVYKVIFVDTYYLYCLGPEGCSTLYDPYFFPWRKKDFLQQQKPTSTNIASWSISEALTAAPGITWFPCFRICLHRQIQDLHIGRFRYLNILIESGNFTPSLARTDLAQAPSIGTWKIGMFVYDIIGWYLFYICINHTEAYIFPSFIYIPKFLS